MSLVVTPARVSHPRPPGGGGPETAAEAPLPTLRYTVRNADPELLIRQAGHTKRVLPGIATSLFGGMSSKVS